jgi:hypothetical protein
MLRDGVLGAPRDHGSAISEADFRTAAKRFVDRLDAMGTAITTAAWLGGLFYLWRDIDGEEAMQAKLAEVTREDAEFLTILLSFHGWVSSDRVYRPIQEKEIKGFFPKDDARKRASAFFDKVKGEANDLREMARDVKVAFKEGDALNR